MSDKKKKVSLFSKAMKEKKLNVDNSKGFPEVQSYDFKSMDIKPDPKENSKQEDPEIAQVDRVMKNPFGELSEMDMHRIQHDNMHQIQNASEQDLQTLQELYSKELSEELMKQMMPQENNSVDPYSSQAGGGNSLLDEDDILKDKMVDDFNVFALKNTMFSQEAIRKRDLETFFNRVYYDNFGNYGIYDEKTYIQLKNNESQFNSIDQLSKALNNTAATQSIYSQLIRKITMIFDIWEKNYNSNRDMIVLKVENLEPQTEKDKFAKILEIKSVDISQRLFFDYDLIDQIIKGMNMQNHVNPNLLYSGLQCLDFLVNFSFKDEILKGQMLWQAGDYFKYYDELVDEKALMADIAKEKIFQEFSMMLTKSEFEYDSYTKILNFYQAAFLLSPSSFIKDIVNYHFVTVIKTIVDNLVETKDKELAINNMARLFVCIIRKTQNDKVTIDKIKESMQKFYNQIKGIEVQIFSVLFEFKVLIESQKLESTTSFLVQKYSIDELLGLLKVNQEKTQEKSLRNPTFRILFTSLLYKLSSNKPTTEQLAQIISNFELADNITEDQFVQTTHIGELYKEYFSTNVFNTQSGFLTKNLLLVDYNFSEYLQSCLKFITENLSNSNYSTLGKALSKSLSNGLSVIVSRIDLWYGCSEKLDSKKNISYKAFKHFPRKLMLGLLKQSAQYLIKVIDCSEVSEHLSLIIKTLSVVEHLKIYKDHLSTHFYTKMAQIFSFNTTQIPRLSPLLVLPTSKNLESIYSPKSEYYSNLIDALSLIESRIGAQLYPSIPVHKTFIKILKRIFSDDSAVYLDQNRNQQLRKILVKLLKGIDLKLLATYFNNNNSSVAEIAIDQYQYNSYCDPLFTEILMLFLTKHFDQDIQRFTWTAISLYPETFCQVLQDGFTLGTKIEDYLATQRPGFHLRDIQQTVKEQLQGIIFDQAQLKKNVLYQIIESYAKQK